MLKNQNILPVLQGMPIQTLAKQKNVLNLTYSFERYFKIAAYNTCWMDISFDDDIKMLKSWDKTPQTMITIMNSIVQAVDFDKNTGTIAEHFAWFDARPTPNCFGGKIAQEIAICLASKNPHIRQMAHNAAKLRKPYSETIGNTVEHIALFDQIKDYYKTLTKTATK